jgi:hypothetical protein
MSYSFVDFFGFSVCLSHRKLVSAIAGQASDMQDRVTAGAGLFVMSGRWFRHYWRAELSSVDPIEMNLVRSLHRTLRMNAIAGIAGKAADRAHLASGGNIKRNGFLVRIGHAASAFQLQELWTGRSWTEVKRR